MYLLDVLSKVDTIKPNSYSYLQKKKWVKKIETDIIDYINIHEGERVKNEFSLFDNPKLTLDEKYEDVYVYYVVSMIDLSNAEYVLYNNSALYFNNNFISWKNDFKRTHKVRKNTCISV